MYEYYEDKKRFYIVTELCNGGELYDELALIGFFTEDFAAQIIS
jgi:serine/threonine protein kinase